MSQVHVHFFNFFFVCVICDQEKKKTTKRCVEGGRLLDFFAHTEIVRARFVKGLPGKFCNEPLGEVGTEHMEKRGIVGKE